MWTTNQIQTVVVYEQGQLISIAASSIIIQRFRQLSCTSKLWIVHQGTDEVETIIGVTTGAGALVQTVWRHVEEKFASPEK